MGIGLLNLISIGKENDIISLEPEITFFKITYRRYANYSIEETPQYFKTTPDFGRRCTVNIGKNSDLMHMIYLYVELPTIQLENINNINKNFAWVNKIGLALINYIEIEIGGIIIDRHYGDWLNIWNELTVKKGVRKSYDKMIGNITELSNFSNNKNTYKLYIPFSFWFCFDTSLALPLISLYQADIKIHVEFNDIETCYKISPSYYISILNNICIYEESEQIYQIYNNTKIIAEFIYFDKITQRIYYNPIKGKFIIPSSDNYIFIPIIGSKSNYETYIRPDSVVVKNDDYFRFNKPSIINSYLLVNYIYLDNYERNNFIKKDHEYLIQTIETLPEQSIYSVNSLYKLPFYNSIKLIIWRCILQSNKLQNNQFEYTSYPYTEIKNDLINKSLLVINSINRMELDSILYYSTHQYYQNKLSSIQDGIYIYSFSLNPLELQPSGSLNFSKVDDSYLQLNMNNIINYQNPAYIRGYAVQYNILKIKNGLGDLLFK
jgi:hypothetical protein